MPRPISEKAKLILQAIARGHTYEQILVQELAWTYHDIFSAAAEALEAHEADGPRSYDDRMSEIKAAHPNAYRPWTSDDDQRLAVSFRAGATVQSLAEQFQRQPSAIRSRLAKLNLS